MDSKSACELKNGIISALSDETAQQLLALEADLATVMSHPPEKRYCDPSIVPNCPYIRWMANAWVNYLRLAVCFGIFLLTFGFPADRHLSIEGLVLGSLALWGASSLYFVLAMLFDLVAFWADNVWSLQVMLRFVSSLLGGALIPLALFPAWSKPVLAAMPFQYLAAFPIRCFMGEVGLRSWAIGMISLIVWFATFSLITAWVWNRGTKQYSGVGI